jgi:hypothetical protein
MAIVDHAVALTREQPTSLYFALTTDVANAYAMLCLHHGHCNGVKAKTLSGQDNLTSVSLNISNAQTSSTPDLDIAMLRGKNNLHNIGTTTMKAETSPDEKVHYNTVVIFSDGSGYGAERTLFPEVWGCISGKLPQKC